MPVGGGEITIDGGDLLPDSGIQVFTDLLTGDLPEYVCWWVPDSVELFAGECRPVKMGVKEKSGTMVPFPIAGGILITKPDGVVETSIPPTIDAAGDALQHTAGTLYTFSMVGEYKVLFVLKLGDETVQFTQSLRCSAGV